MSEIKTPNNSYLQIKTPHNSYLQLPDGTWKRLSDGVVCRRVWQGNKMVWVEGAGPVTPSADSTTTGSAVQPYGQLPLPLSPTASSGKADTPTVVTDCHSGVVEIGRVENAVICAGRDTDAIRQWGSAALYIDLQGRILGRIEVRCNLEAAQILDPYIATETPSLSIDWPDYGVPHFGRKWWHKLAESIRRVEGKVIVTCLGGHGRTGTCIAILAKLLGLVPDGACPVEWLRALYCKSVVESWSQIEYIEKILEIKVAAKPRLGFYDGESVFAALKKAEEKDAEGFSKMYPKGKDPVKGPHKWTMSIRKAKRILRKRGDLRKVRDLPEGTIIDAGKHGKWLWMPHTSSFNYVVGS